MLQLHFKVGSTGVPGFAKKSNISVAKYAEFPGMGSQASTILDCHPGHEWRGRVIWNMHLASQYIFYSIGSFNTKGGTPMLRLKTMHHLNILWQQRSAPTLPLKQDPRVRSVAWTYHIVGRRRIRFKLHFGSRVICNWKVNTEEDTKHEKH